MQVVQYIAIPTQSVILEEADPYYPTAYKTIQVIP